MRHRWITLLTLIVASVVHDVAAQCRVASLAPCVLELHGDGAPRRAGSCADERWRGYLEFGLPDRFADGNGDGWHEAVLQLDLAPGCGCATFRITFEGTPDGVSVNIGDSPTNDGHGGDAETTRFDAELMMSGPSLSAFAAEQPGTPLGAEQLFGLRDLPIADRTFELEVCDQSVRFAIGSDDTGFRGFFHAVNARDLIAIRLAPEDGAAPATTADSKIYAAFNRVIHRRTGPPVHGRYGTGVRRVEISLTP